MRPVAEGGEAAASLDITGGQSSLKNKIIDVRRGGEAIPRPPSLVGFSLNDDNDEKLVRS